MAVLVTRPNPEGSELCSMLTANNIHALHQPLIRYLASDSCSTNKLSNQLNSADIVIAVSKRAVEWADKLLHTGSSNGSTPLWPSTANYLAIGKATADILSSVTNKKINYPDISDSENLLALQQLKNVTGSQIVILRGNGGRELLHSSLTKRGALVSYCEVYQRSTVLFEGDSQVRAWQKDSISHIVITSGEQLTYLVQKIPPEFHMWLFKRSLIVPSSRLSSLAKEIGFYKVIVSASASNQDLCSALYPQYLNTQCATGRPHDK